MNAHELYGVMEREPDFTVEDRSASFWKIATFGDGMLWIGRFTGESPWERHTAGDELLHVLEGEVLVTVLTDDESKQTTVPAGSVFVVPKGCWHRQLAREIVMQYGVTPGQTEHSFAEDPR